MGLQLKAAGLNVLRYSIYMKQNILYNITNLKKLYHSHPKNEMNVAHPK